MSRRYFNPPIAATAICLAATALSLATPAAARGADGANDKSVKLVREPLTQPATRPAVPPPPRTLIWDRTRRTVLTQQQHESAVQIADLEASLRVAEQRTANNPNDPGTRSILERARRTLEEARARDAKLRAATAELPPLEKAAYLGIATSPAPPVLRKQLKLAEGMGLVVDFVEPGSPAEQAGVQPYDVAVRLNDQVLINAPQLAVLVRTFDAGAEVTLTVVREGKETPLKIKLVEREVKAIADTAFGPVWTDVAAATRPRNWVLPPQPRREAPNRVVKQGDVLLVRTSNLEGAGLETWVQVVIGPEATVRLPQLKDAVNVRGLNEGQIEAAIRDAYRQTGRLDQADVKVEFARPNR
jgi:protein involved in polysaccharide export with SLBB domain